MRYSATALLSRAARPSCGAQHPTQLLPDLLRHPGASQGLPDALPFHPSMSRLTLDRLGTSRFSVSCRADLGERMTATANEPSTALANDDRTRTAERLLSSAARISFDPQVDIDWDAPPVPGLWYAPPERSTLYGTSLWRRMPEAQRIELTKHEVASIASVGIWFETILTQMLVRSLYDRSMTDAHARFPFTEIADECRHSMMFGRMIETLGCPDYGPGRLAHALGRPFKTLSNGTLTFAGALYVEEILDALQREAMSDERVQPLVRAVSRVHVIEEARHMRYARDETARQVAELGRV